MAQPPSPTKTATNPRIAKLIELETRGVIKPEHEEELNVYRAQGLAPSAPKSSLTEAQGKATGFYGRALEADENFTKTHSATEPRGLIAQTAANIAPGLANTLSSPDRQMSEQAKRNFILASLRYESGASINADEFEKQDRAFFPQPGDGPEVIAQKAKDRQVVIQGLKEGAGPGATGMQSAAPPADPNAPEAGATVTAPILEAGSSNLIGAPSTGPRATIDLTGKDQFTQTPEFRAGLATLMNDPNATADQIRDYWAKNAKGGLPSDTPSGATPPPPPLAVERGKSGLTDRADAIIRGAADTASLGFADELAAGARTVFGDKTMAENLAAERGVDDYDTQNHFGFRLAGQLAGGTVLPMGEATDAASLAKAGGGYGAAYGFGSTNGSLKDRFVGAGIGGVTGAAGGYGLGRLSELFQGRAPMPPGPPPTGNAVADAAARRNIPVIAADVAPGARGANSFLESIPFAGGVVRRRMQAGNDAIEQQVGDVAADTGMAADRIDTGEAVQGAAKQWVPRSGQIGSALYDRISIPRRSPATIDNTRAALEQLTQGLESNPELSKIWVDNPRLKATLDALTSKDVLVDQPLVGGGKGQPLSAIKGGEISWGDLKRLRSIVGEIAGSPSLGSDGAQVAAMKKLYAGLSADMENTALKNGPRAYREFQKANDFWRQRETRLDDVVAKVIGPNPSRPLSGEAVMSQIERWSQNKTGSGVRLENLFSSLGRPGSDARQQAAASIAHALGRASPEADFSPKMFFNQVDRMSNRSRVTLFGQQGAEALSDLATVANARAGTIAKLNNSGSGRVSNYLQVLKGLMGLGAGGGVGAASGIGAPAGAAITAAGLGAAHISARVLTNPSVARALAQGFRATSEQAAQKTITRLGNIATSNPAIRTEVLSIQRRLAQAVNDNLPVAGRAAASPDEGPGNEQ